MRRMRRRRRRRRAIVQDSYIILKNKNQTCVNKIHAFPFVRRISLAQVH
jgi:hypothetical protein